MSERSERAMGTPISCRSEDAIRQATLDLLFEHGFTGLTVDAVAARAGVGKATIYRHWGSRAGLVADVAACSVVPIDVPDTGSLRGDLRSLLRQLATVLTRADLGRLLPSMVDAAERDPELAALKREHTRQRRHAIEQVIDRAVDRGEIVGDVDASLLIDVLVAPFFYRRLVSRMPVRTADIDPLLDLVLRGIGAEAPARSTA